MYAAVLAGDVDAAMALVDPEVVYEDTTFPESLDYDGVRALFGQVREKLPEDFAFVIDEVADGGTAVGLTYHAELSGTPLQGSKGTAFYRYNPETFKLVYCRECNEPSVKMGSGALDMLRVMAPFLRGPQ